MVKIYPMTYSRTKKKSNQVVLRYKPAQVKRIPVIRECSYGRVADPGEVDPVPDPTLQKKPDLDQITKKKQIRSRRSINNVFLSIKKGIEILAID